jgi:hypothetical protein
MSTSDRFRLKSDDTTHSDELEVMNDRNFPFGDMRILVNGPLDKC